MNKVITVIFLLTLCLTSIAQNILTGRVVDSDELPIPFANVIIMSQSDSTLIKGGISDDEGVFNIPYSHSGELHASIQYMGYQDYQMPIIKQNGTINLGQIKLEQNNIAIHEVVVKSKIPLFEHKVDRTVVNVQSSITNAGNTALNVLSKSPGVNISRMNGQISLQGKGGVLVMINEKEVRMESSDLINLLEGMPAANIKDIELISTPPAKYDAQGIAGIININMLESNTDGFKGRASAFGGMAKDPKYGGAFNAHLNKGKFRTYANLSADVNIRQPHIKLNSNSQYGDEAIISDMVSHRDTKTGLYSGELGISYDLTDHTEAGLSYNIYNRDFTMDAVSNTTSQSTIKGENSQKVFSNEVNNMVRMMYNAYINHRFSSQVKLSLDYDYINFRRDNPTSYNTINNEGSSHETRTKAKSEAETPLDIHVGTADFELKLNDHLKLESGIKYSHSAFENKVRVSELEHDEYVNDPAYTRIYNMNEKVMATYASADWKINPKLSAKAGVRYEHYQLDMTTSDNKTMLNNKQGDFFPSLYANYSINENKGLNASYAKRIQRPGFLQLAPYFYFFNSNTLVTGNPRLTPSYSHQFRLNYNYKQFNIGVEYSDTDDPIYTWQPNKNTERQTIILAPIQGIKSSLYSIFVYVPWEITQRWTSNYYLLACYRDQQTQVMNQPWSKKSNNLNLSMSHTYELSHNWLFELNLWHNTAYYEGAIKIKTLSSLDLGLQHKFKNGSSIALNISDVYGASNVWHLQNNNPEQGIAYNFKWEAPSPVVRLNLSIPLGNNKLEVKKKRKSAANDELKRL